MRAFYEMRRNDFQSETGLRAGPDRLLTNKGRIYFTKSDTGGYDWGSYTFRPITPGHKKEASVAKIIARGELRAANPSLMSTIQSAPVAQTASAPAGLAIAPTADPRWGVLAELSERDFVAENGIVFAFRWSDFDRTLLSIDSKLGYRTDYELNKDMGEITEIHFERKTDRGRRIGRNRANPDGSYRSIAGGSIMKVSNAEFRLGLRRIRDIMTGEKAAELAAELVRSGKLRAANPQLTSSVQASAERPSLASAAAPAQPVVTSQMPPTPVYNIPQGQGPRLALVIGNSTYGASMGALRNPANDADAMAAALKSLGFTVHLVKNADQNTMKRAIVRFGQRLTTAGKGATGLFFYAGHGVQHRGINYLVPVNAEVSSQADIEAVAADTVLRQMVEAGSSTNIVILDACHNMPLVRGFRSASAGLAPMDAPNGSFIAYSTAPGSVAADGAGGNSPFVTALIRNLERKGESIEGIFRDVRREVVTTTEGTQTPWDSSSLMQPFYFAGK